MPVVVISLVMIFPALVSSFSTLNCNDKKSVPTLSRHGYFHSVDQKQLPLTRKVTTSNLGRVAVVRRMSIMDDVQGFFKRFTQKASASHILLRGDGAQVENQLEDWKVEIDNSPIKFAEYAGRFSQCPSSSSGGDLGEFGPGTMVQEFDEVVFDPTNDVGIVHGPIKTQFGYHLIFIRDRTE